MKSTSYSQPHTRLRTSELSIIKTVDEISGLKIVKDHAFNPMSEEKLKRLNKLAAERPFANRHKPRKHDPL